jgi:hypothetical protein
MGMRDWISTSVVNNPCPYVRQGKRFFSYVQNMFGNSSENQEIAKHFAGAGNDKMDM